MSYESLSTSCTSDHAVTGLTEMPGKDVTYNVHHIHAKAAEFAEIA